MSRLFAVIPAAGRSRRMGRPKLLLPWGTGTVIEQVLRVFHRPEVTAVYVVVRPDDVELQTKAAAAGGTVVVPASAPPEMRDSVEIALRRIEFDHAPAADDGWLLAPADHPVLAPAILDALIDRWKGDDRRILIPTHAGRRGHPVAFPWELAPEVFGLPRDEGLNALVRRRSDLVVETPIDDSAVLADLDTPADYERLRPAVQ